MRTWLSQISFSTAICGHSSLVLRAHSLGSEQAWSDYFPMFPGPVMPRTVCELARCYESGQTHCAPSRNGARSATVGNQKQSPGCVTKAGEVSWAVTTEQ